jgi:hypothetical protein
MNVQIIVPGIVAISLLLGCDDPLTAEDLAGTYSLAGMDARPLPQLLTATLTCDEWVQGGDLSLQRSGEFMLVVRGELDCTRAGGQVQVVGWEYPGIYSISGTALQFVSPVYPSGELQFSGAIDPWRMRVRIPDLALHPSNTVDLEFRR